MSAKVAVNFLTYTPSLEHPRVQYAHQCLKALVQNLDYDGELLWHIADDGSPVDHVFQLLEICKERGVTASASITPHIGYGGNMNLATQTLHSIADVILSIEEDWELVRPFDITHLVEALGEGERQFPGESHISCIRLGYLGWTNELSGHLVQYANQTFLRFSEHSIENHVWAGHPRLETVAYQKRVGEWPEGMAAGYTELEVGKRLAARKGVAWPLDAGINASQDYNTLFAHVGEVQA